MSHPFLLWTLAIILRVVASEEEIYYGLPIGEIAHEESGTFGKVFIADTQTIIITNFTHQPEDDKGCYSLILGPAVGRVEGAKITLREQDGILLRYSTLNILRRRRSIDINFDDSSDIKGTRQRRRKRQVSRLIPRPAPVRIANVDRVSTDMLIERATDERNAGNAESSAREQEKDVGASLVAFAVDMGKGRNGRRRDVEGDIIDPHNGENSEEYVETLSERLRRIVRQGEISDREKRLTTTTSEPLTTSTTQEVLITTEFSTTEELPTTEESSTTEDFTTTEKASTTEDFTTTEEASTTVESEDNETTETTIEVESRVLDDSEEATTGLEINEDSVESLEDKDLYDEEVDRFEEEMKEEMMSEVTTSIAQEKEEVDKIMGMVQDNNSTSEMKQSTKDKVGEMMKAIEDMEKKEEEKRIESEMKKELLEEKMDTVDGGEIEKEDHVEIPEDEKDQGTEDEEKDTEKDESSEVEKKENTDNKLKKASLKDLVEKMAKKLKENKKRAATETVEGSGVGAEPTKKKGTRAHKHKMDESMVLLSKDSKDSKDEQPSNRTHSASARQANQQNSILDAEESTPSKEEESKEETPQIKKPSGPFESNEFSIPQLKESRASFNLRNNGKISNFHWLGLYDQCKKKAYQLHEINGLEMPDIETLAPIAGVAANVSSDNVMIVNCNTIVVQNFAFTKDEKRPHTFFHVGAGVYPLSVQSHQRVRVLGTDINDVLESTSGRDLVIRLPEGIRTFDIDFLMVFNEDTKRAYGHTFIPSLLVPLCDIV